MPGGGTVMILPRKSMGRLVMTGASGMAISFALGGALGGTRVIRNGGGADAAVAGKSAATGAATATGRDSGASGTTGGSIRRRILRSRPANLDLTMFDMTFVF
jgi:hypothetical protein